MITTRLENAVKETKTLFGKRVRALRKNKGLSQEELAEKTDISSKYLSRVEMGQHFPSIDTLDKLANALKVDLKDFFEFAHEARSSRELREVLSGMLKEAGEEKLRLLVKIVRAVIR